jgi:hypothetical protein
MRKFVIGAVIVIAAIASGIGAAALAGPRVGQYLQARVSTSSRQFRAPNPMPFPGMRRPWNGRGVPGYRGISSQSSSQVQNSLDAFGSYSQWGDSNSKIAGLPGFSGLDSGQ